MASPLFTDSEWNFATLENVYNACETIAFEDLNLNIYQNQLEVISSEQMLDAYSSSGLPIYSLSRHASTLGQTALYRGVYPVFFREYDAIVCL